MSAGASGAIFGLMAALVVAGHAVKADVTQVLVLIGINLAIGFLVGGIDWRAHLGRSLPARSSPRSSPTRRAGAGPWSRASGSP